MKKSTRVLTALALCIPLMAHAQECHSPLIHWNNYDQTLRNLKAQYHQEDYQAVDKALACLVQSSQTFLSGKPGAAAAYWFYRNELSGAGADADDAARVEKWKTAAPKSPYAHFAGIRLLYSQAWGARGTRYANETSAQQFQRFHDTLARTEQALLSDANALKETALSYNLLMAVGLDMQDSKTSPIAVFEEGVKKWPGYYDFYEVFLTRITPKWGGSWQAVDDFIQYWSEKRQSREGDSLYARLYYNVHMHNHEAPFNTKVDWARLKPALASLYTQYPDPSHYAIAASYACIYSDDDFYKKLIATQKVASTNAWLPGTSLERCTDTMRHLENPPKK